jgi:hypothetical protein
MYPSLLVLHSWIRWLALGAVLFVFLRALRGAFAGAAWTGKDAAWIKGAAHLMTMQFVLGVLLYAVSPYIRSLLDNMSATMQDRTSRLFAVEHAVMMTLALGLLHAGSAVARKGSTDAAKHKRAAIFFGVALLVIGYAIPWMRPMFRMGM